MTHPTPYPDVNTVLPGHPYLAIIFDMGGVLMDWNPRHLYRKLSDGDSDSQYSSPEQLATEVCCLIDLTVQTSRTAAARTLMAP
jgi:hypothetical protein